MLFKRLGLLLAVMVLVGVIAAVSGCAHQDVSWNPYLDGLVERPKPPATAAPIQLLPVPYPPLSPPVLVVQ